MRYLNILLAVLFVLFAALQWNDPDPWVWVPLYLFAAIICVEAVRGNYHPILCITGMIMYLGYAALLFFENNGVLSWAREHDAESLVQTMKATKPWIEATREFGGLLICFVAVLLNYLKPPQPAVE